MCGRYTLKTPAAIVQEIFGLPELPAIVPRYNIAPSQPLAVVLGTDEERELREMRWGLIPYWAKEASIGNRMINARAETVSEKPAYRRAFRERRCLVPADGFYEWQRVGHAARQPWYLSLVNDAPFAFAGLWDRWRDHASGTYVESCAILTTEPNSLLQPIHDRMPVILDAAGFSTWLDSESDTADLEATLLPYSATEMQARTVGTRVNSPNNDDPRCIERVDPEPQPRTLFD